jgi:hypothetical protein
MAEMMRSSAMRQSFSLQIGAALTVVACWAGLSTSAQTPQEKARIDFETAKKALAAGQPELALKKFEAVEAALGPLPELSVYCAKAAAATGDWATAKKHVQAAFASADPTFKKSKAYEDLMGLASDIELHAADGEKRAAAEEAALAAFGLTGKAQHEVKRKQLLGDCKGTAVPDFGVERVTKTAWNQVTTDVNSDPAMARFNGTTQIQHDQTLRDYQEFVGVTAAGVTLRYRQFESTSGAPTEKETNNSGKATTYQCTDLPVQLPAAPAGPRDNCFGFKPGQVVSSSDEGTGKSVTVAEQEETIFVGGRQVRAWRTRTDYSLDDGLTSVRETEYAWWVCGAGQVRSKREGTSVYRSGELTSTVKRVVTDELVSMRYLD